MSGRSYPTFIVDEMLGKLARWLRIFKFDAKYAKEERQNNPNLTDRTILNIAIVENRILITRDRELYKLAIHHGAQAILIEDDNLEKQIVKIAKRSKIRELPFFDKKLPLRCAICNTPLVRVSKSGVKKDVPPRVYENFNVFWKCPNCGKVYWPGSHWRMIIKRARRIQEILREDP